LVGVVFVFGEVLLFVGCLLGVWVASFVSWVFVGGLPLGFWGFSLFLGALRFFNKIFLLIKKKMLLALFSE